MSCRQTNALQARALLFDNKLVYCHEPLPRSLLNKECCRCCCGALKVLLPSAVASSSKHSRSFSSSEKYTSSSSDTSCPPSESEDKHQRHSHLFSPRHRFSSAKNMLNIAKACRRFKSATSSSTEEDFDLHELAAILNESLKTWDQTYAAFVRLLANGSKLHPLPSSSKLHKQQQHQATTSQLSSTRTTSSIFKFKYDHNKELNFRKINTISNETTTTTTSLIQQQQHIALFIQAVNPLKFVCTSPQSQKACFAERTTPSAAARQMNTCWLTWERAREASQFELEIYFY